MSDTGSDNRRTRLREALIQHATDLVGQEGLGALQARRLAQMAGCSVGAIYNVFPDLDDLILRANATTLRQMGEQSRHALAVLPSGARRGEKMMALALAYLAFAYERETAWRAVFEYRPVQRKPYPDWYMAVQAEAFAPVERLFTAEPGPAERRLARTIWAAVHGVVSAGMDRRLGERPAEESRAEIAAQLRILVHALEAGL